ncbi:MAG: hypothetical protein K8L91_15790 [Anaerolineae bacterium]|nr:hypothetical protein [Anaerolineae bacterium]
MASKNARLSPKQSGVGLLDRVATKSSPNGNNKPSIKHVFSASETRNGRASRKAKLDVPLYNGSNAITIPDVTETLHPHQPSSSEEANTIEEITTFARYAASVFIAALNFLKERQPKRQPTRVEKLKNLFEGREEGIVFLDEIIECFSGTKDAKDSAYSAIYFANKLFEEIGADLEIKQYICYRLVSKKSSTD